jgi:hypothetical protein
LPTATKKKKTTKKRTKRATAIIRVNVNRQRVFRLITCTTFDELEQQVSAMLRDYEPTDTRDTYIDWIGGPVVKGTQVAQAFYITIYTDKGAAADAGTEQPQTPPADGAAS